MKEYITWTQLVPTSPPTLFCIFFFFNDTAPTEIYTLSLHDALPISSRSDSRLGWRAPPSLRPASEQIALEAVALHEPVEDRKSTRLNSSHSQISYAVFCLKKKKITYTPTLRLFRLCFPIRTT